MLCNRFVRFLGRAGLLATTALAAASVHAQAWPAKPVALVIPSAPGGPMDGEMRIHLDKLQAAFGKPFVFDYRAGAGTSIGTGYVARSAPDGHTLLLHNGGFTVHPNLYPDLPYNVQKSFAPVTMVSERPTVIIVSPVALPEVRSIADLVAYGKANPGKLNCGTSGQGNITHIVCASLSAAINIPITPIHYKGAAQNQTDMMAGRTHLAAGTLFNALPLIKSGKLRAIAASNPERSKQLPDLRTTFEQGADVEQPTWLGILAPAGTPAAIINSLQAEMKKIVFAPENLKMMDAQGIVPVVSTPEDFRKRIATEAVRWKKFIEEKGIKAEE
jgi:tripartite-type tricarboxylate transporter receptor subunit TctC